MNDSRVDAARVAVEEHLDLNFGDGGIETLIASALTAGLDQLRDADGSSSDASNRTLNDPHEPSDSTVVQMRRQIDQNAASLAGRTQRCRRPGASRVHGGRPKERADPGQLSG